MQALIKRYFWVLGAIAVMICAVFAAKAANHVVEAKYLGDPDHAPKLQATAMLPTTTPKVTRTKDGAPLAARDMFCSDCTPPVVVASNNNDPSSIVNTSLPLSLLATNVSLDDDESYATVVNTDNQKQGSYSIGDPIPGASGKLKEIHYKYIDFENGGHVERLVLNGAAPPVVAAVVPAPGDGSGDDMQALVDSGVKKIDDHHYEIDRALVDKILANPMGVAKGARVVPAVKNGKPDGFKLYAIRPTSVYAKIGLENGDTLQAINGMEMTSAEKALEVYTKLRDASSLEVDITRKGKADKMNYSIR